jgi:hypothetical protein
MILLNVVWFGLVWFPLVTNHLPVKLAVVAMLSERKPSAVVASVGKQNFEERNFVTGSAPVSNRYKEKDLR